MPEMLADPLASITFITKDKKFEVPKNEYSLSIKSTSTNLASLLKTLLKHGDDIEFDFLINGQVLASSIEDYINKNSLTLEKIIEVEFAGILPSPVPKISYENDDWVSSVQAININDTCYFLTGCYNGSISVWNYDQKIGASPLFSKVVHEGPIKALKYIPNAFSVKENSLMFLTASHDSTIKSWKLELQTSKSSSSKSNTWMLQLLSVCRGHEDSVDCLGMKPQSVNDTPDMFCSGSWDTMIKIWSLYPTSDEKFISAKEDNKIEKSKLDKKTQLPRVTFNQHDDVVSALEWITPGEICSVSWDNRLRLWDVETQKTKTTMVGQKALLALSYNPISQLIVTGSTDSHIRLWDPRSDSGTIVKGIYSSHKNWVSCIKWSPLNEHQFTSGSYDGLVKIWDKRNSSTPLYNLHGQKDKVLCNEWSTQNLIVNGGTDKTIQIFEI